MARGRFMLIVVAFDDNDRDACFIELPQHEHRVIGGLRVNIAAIKKVAGDDHEINPAGDGMAFNDFTPGAEKVARAVWQIVALDAEMNICDVEKSCHAISKRWQSPNNQPIDDARAKRSHFGMSLINQP